MQTNLSRGAIGFLRDFQARRNALNTYDRITTEYGSDTDWRRARRAGREMLVQSIHMVAIAFADEVIRCDETLRISAELVEELESA
jgi:hypothetical protein